MFNVDELTVNNEEDGVWAEFRGSKFLIASSGSTKFQRLFSKLQTPHRKAISRGNLDPAIQLDIMSRAMSQALLLDWKDVIDSQGNIVNFNTDIAFKVLKGNSELRDFITEYATDIANYRQEEKEDLGKSVEKLSDGKPNSENE